MNEELFLQHQQADENAKPKKKKTRRIILCIVLAIIAWGVISDIADRPLWGRTHEVLKFDPEAVTMVEILHYGKTVTITEPEKIDELLEKFDCYLKRPGRNISCGCTAGGPDWNITFITDPEKKEDARSLGFDPENDILYAAGYRYHSDKVISREWLERYWAAESIPVASEPSVNETGARYVHADWPKIYVSVEELAEDAEFAGLVKLTAITDQGASSIGYTVYSGKILDPVYNPDELTEIPLFMNGAKTDTKHIELEGDPLMEVGETWFVFARKNDMGSYTVLAPGGRFRYDGEDKIMPWVRALAGIETDCELTGGFTLEELKAKVQEALK